MRPAQVSYKKMNSFDSSIETYLSNLHFGHFATQSIEVIADLYTFKGLVLIPVLWWMWFQQDKRREWRREMVLATLLSSVVALFVGRLLTHWLPFRVRPIYSDELHLHFAGSAIKDALLTSWSSFSSDHAMLWMAVATGIFLVWRGIGVLAVSLPCCSFAFRAPTWVFTTQPICWWAPPWESALPMS
jgi:undecaprenyl-diphosphatase